MSTPERDRALRDEEHRWRVMQLADGGFPAGGFAHSGGLEAAVHLGEVRDGAALASFVTESLWNAGTSQLPFVRAAYEQPDRFDALDARIDARLTSVVANRASRTQGRAFLGACAGVFAHDALRSLERRARTRSALAHYAPTFGFALGALGVRPDATHELFLFHVARGVTSAAVRLGVAGPHEAQQLLASLGPTFARVAAHGAALSIDEAASTAPLLELWGSAHDRLYSKLFQS